MAEEVYWSGTLTPDQQVSEQDSDRIHDCVEDTFAIFKCDNGGFELDYTTQQHDDAVLKALQQTLADIYKIIPGITFSGELYASGDDDYGHREIIVQKNVIVKESISATVRVRVPQKDAPLYYEVLGILRNDLSDNEREFILKFIKAYKQSDLKEVLEEWAKQATTEVAHDSHD